MNNALKIVLASALITAAAIKAVPALAEPAAPATRIVQTSDLNLASVAGQRQLDIRLARAAREVCGTASNLDIAGKNDVRECRNQVLAAARAKAEAVTAAKTTQSVLVASRH